MGRTLKGLSFLFLTVIVFKASSAAQTWISGVTPSTKTTSATITWISAVPADSQVKYGLSASSYASRTSLDATRVGSHAVAITGLTAATTYHFRVISRDASGIAITSLDYRFTTEAIPISVSVSLTSASVTSGKTQQFTATVNNSSHQSVTWSA